MWDLQSGDIVGTHESYARSGSDPVEPCELHFVHSIVMQVTDGYMLLDR